MKDQISFDPLYQMIDSVASLTHAFQLGNTKFINDLPYQFKETIGVLASKRLDHSAANFKESVLWDLEDDILIVQLDPDNWLANAVESGANSWPMVKTHLKNKTKISKEGFKYKVIPLRVWTTSASAKTKTGIDYFNKAKAALKKPQFKNQTQKQGPQGAVIVKEELIAEDAELQGMFRVREFASQQAFLEQKRPKQTQYVLFRTMSEKYPEKWVHPGIAPANILKDALTLIESELEKRWDTMIQAELQKRGFS
jgi:hypothetical protein